MDRAAGAELVQEWGREADPASEDETIAAHCGARLLITASSADAVETLARRVHAASFRAASPFIRVGAGGLPLDPWMLRKTCANLIQAANGGSLLLTDVEEMPSIVQGRFIELLDELQSSSARSAVRLIVGTTVSLCDRIADGTFSAQLFYRLNIIHLMVEDAAP